MLYLRRLGHGFIEGCCSTFDPFLNGFVPPLGIAVALRHRRSLLYAELGQLRPDLQQLVNVRLVLCDGLPEQLQSQSKGRENIRRSSLKELSTSHKSSTRLVKDSLFNFIPSSGPAAPAEHLCRWPEEAAG